MRLPTVKIKADTKLGYMIINESDYDASVHTPYEEPKEGEAGEESKEEAPSEGGKEEKADSGSGRSRRGRQVKQDETDLTGNPFE